MDPLGLFLFDQVFLVEYELDKFNTPHTETTLCHPQNWLCRLRCRIPLRHLATSPPGNIFWRHSRFSPKQPEPQTLGDFNVSLLKQQTHFCYTMANISPSHAQRHTLLSPLSHNFISFPYFFPYYETCSVNVNSLFHAAVKNLHFKAKKKVKWMTYPREITISSTRLMNIFSSKYKRLKRNCRKSKNKVSSWKFAHLERNTDTTHTYISFHHYQKKTTFLPYLHTLVTTAIQFVPHFLFKLPS